MKKLWNILKTVEKKHHGGLHKTMKLWFIMEKAISCTKTIKIFEQINSFGTLIYLGKTMFYRKTMKKA